MPRVRLFALTALVLVVLVSFVVVPLYIATVSTRAQECAWNQTPRDVGIEGYEELTLETRDGIPLSTWVIPGEGGAGNVTVVIMHGYTSCKANPRLLALAKALWEWGANVVLFDFRAHGDSGSDRTTIGPQESQDAATVVDYVVDRWPHSRVVLVGFSMGGAVAVVVGAQDGRVGAVVADSPYYRLGDVVPRWIGSRTPLPEWYGRLIAFYGALMSGGDLGFGPGSVNPPVNKPLTIIYGDKDPLITPQEMEEIAGKSPCGKALGFKGLGHVEALEALGPQKYADIILETLNRPCEQPSQDQ